MFCESILNTLFLIHCTISCTSCNHVSFLNFFSKEVCRCGRPNSAIGLGFVDDNNVDEDGNDGCDDKHCKVVVEIDQHCGVGVAPRIV